MVWFTSDWHFNHNKEFIYAKRGFSSVEEMNEEIIKRHNEVVGPDDIVYCLGDACMGPNLEANKTLIERLNGTIYIIPGNHDTDNRLAMYWACNNVAGVFQYSYRYKTNEHGHTQHLWLSHYPTITSNLEKSDRLEEHIIDIYGHTHQKTNFYEEMPFMYHAGVDSHNCYPVSYDQIIDDIKEKIEDCKSQL